MKNVLSILSHWKSSSKRLIPSNIRFLATVCCLAAVCLPAAADDADANEDFPLEVVSITVTPHQKLEGIEFDYEDEPSVGGRVQLFIRNTAPADSKKRKTQSMSMFCALIITSLSAMYSTKPGPGRIPPQNGRKTTHPFLRAL